jgi:hypothetical protein
VEEILGTDTASGTLTFPVQGWQWWMVLVARWNVDNSGGVGNANAVIQISGGSGIVAHAIQATNVAAGNSVAVCMGIAGSVQNLLAFMTAALPPAIVIGDGAISVGFTGGNAGTKTNGIHLVLLGRVGQRLKGLKR